MVSWLPCIKRGDGGEKGEKDALLINGPPPSPENFDGGGKTIGFVGGLSLLINNITGPAMVTMPLLFQNAGWFTPTLVILIMTVFSVLASSLMCEAMAAIPGNHHFEGRVEFSTLVSFFFGKRAKFFAQVFINVSLQCANIAAIIECAQVADDAIIKILGRSCGLQLYPHFYWQCVTDAATSDSPFDSNAYYLFTAGFLFMMVIVIPMGMLNLDDNIFIQVIANIFLVIVMSDFMVTFFMHGLNFSNVPFFKGSGQSPVLGVIMANYGFVTTIPSWCSEKKLDVSVNKSLWIAVPTASSVFWILGFFGALSFKYPDDSDILSVINGSSYSNLLTKVLVYLFPVMVLATTIPVFSIIVRYNLLQSKINKKLANLMAVVLPWVVVIPFLTGSGLNNVLNWGTLLFTSIANFIIPFAIYIKAYTFQTTPHVLNENQKDILRDLSLVDNYDGDINPYRALPGLPNHSPVNPRGLAYTGIMLLSSLVLAVIGLNIQSLT